MILSFKTSFYKIIKSIEYLAFIFMIIFITLINNDYYAFENGYFALVSFALENRLFLMVSLILFSSYIFREMRKSTNESLVRRGRYIVDFLMKVLEMLILALVFLFSFLLISLLIAEVLKMKSRISVEQIAYVSYSYEETLKIISEMKEVFILSCLQYVLGMTSLGSLIFLLIKNIRRPIAIIVSALLALSFIYNIVLPFADVRNNIITNLIISVFPLNLISAFYTYLNLGSAFIFPVIIFQIFLIILCIFIVNNKSSKAYGG